MEKNLLDLIGDTDEDKSNITSEKKQLAEITINGFTEYGYVHIQNEELDLELKEHHKKIPYKDIVAATHTDDNKVLITLSNDVEITLNTQDNEVLVSAINDRNVETNKGKIIIHGCDAKLTYIDLLNNGKLVASIANGKVYEYTIEEDTTLTFKCQLYKPLQLEVHTNENIEVFLIIDSHHARAHIVAKSNNISSEQYNEIVNQLHPIPITSTTTTQGGIGCLGVIGIVAAIIILIPIINYFSPMTESKICTRIRPSVEKRLKDPSSAKFADDCSVIKNGDTWSVTGTVSGTNGFGGVSSHKYYVVVNVDGHNYKIVGVSFY